MSEFCVIGTYGTADGEHLPELLPESWHMQFNFLLSPSLNITYLIIVYV